MTKREQKIKWSFLVETDVENLKALENDMLTDDAVLWQIPHDRVIGVLKVDNDEVEK